MLPCVYSNLSAHAYQIVYVRTYAYQPHPFFRRWRPVSLCKVLCSPFHAITHASPSGDDTLTPEDAVSVLEEIVEAENRSYRLGLKLKLPSHVVDSIKTQYSDPRDMLLQVLLEFMRQTEPRPTWRVIVDALRSPAVNLPHLAERVEAAHFPNPSATGI